MMPSKTEDKVTMSKKAFQDLLNDIAFRERQDERQKTAEEIFGDLEMDKTEIEAGNDVLDVVYYSNIENLRSKYLKRERDE